MSMLDQGITGNVRPGSVDYHIGTPNDFLNRYRVVAHRAAMEGEEAVREFAKHLFRRIARTTTLGIAFDHLVCKGGLAPGPNGLIGRDLGRSEKWELLRLLKKQLKDADYRHGPVKTVRLPKGPGRGFRTITLENLEDRIVGRAAVEIVQPLLDPTFDPHSYCRFGKGRLHALARVESLVQRTGRRIWIAEDIRDAFGQVPHSRLLDIVRKRLPATDFVELIERLIENETGKGLRQGACASPMLMNLYLDHFLDRRWHKLYPKIPLLRFMDDLLAMCGQEDDPEAVYADLNRVLRDAAMPLKGNLEDCIFHLDQGDRVPWLGFLISARNGQLEYRFHENERRNDLVERLREKLMLVHSLPDSPLRAISVIHGVVDQAGPCFPFEDHCDIYDRVTAVAREMAFEEIPTRTAFVKRWSKAFDKWCSLRKRLIQHDSDAATRSAQEWQRVAHNETDDDVLDEFNPPW